MRLVEFGVRKPVVSNLAAVALIGAGLMFGLQIRREFFPEVRPNLVRIIAPYPGASPDEVEDSLALKIEDRVADLDNVKEVNTTVLEGLCTVFIEFVEGVNINEAVFEVKREMDSLQDLPRESDRIVVDKFEPNIPAINLSLYGDSDERSLKQAMEEIRTDLRSLPGMGDIVASGVRTDEISVEVAPASLVEHGLSLPRIAARIREEMAELPAGSVRTATSNVAVRVTGAEEEAEAIRRVIVKADADGQVLRLGEIARVREGFVDVDLRSRLNGKPCASLTVYKVGNEDAIDIADMVKAYAAGRRGEPIRYTWRERLSAAFRGQEASQPVSRRIEAYELGRSRTEPLPGTLVITTDLARFIVGRLNLLMENAFQGSIGLMLCLMVFLNFRVAFWVFNGLFVAMLGTFAVMYFTGASLNLLSMLGLIIVLGIQTDDAVVVSENIVARHEAGETPTAAAINGATQVAWPVVSTVITTVVAFLPLALIGGTIGDMLEVLPLLAVCALFTSLFESLFILPGHIKHSLTSLDRARASGRVGIYRRIEARIDAARERVLQRTVVPAYAAFLRPCLQHRYVTLAAGLACIIASLGMIAGGRLPFTFIGGSDAETINAQLVMPIGTSIEETDAIMRKLEAAALAQPEVTSAFASVGAYTSLEGDTTIEQSHVGQLILELTPVESRNRRPSEEVIVAIRKQVGELPGVKSLAIEELTGGPQGPSITLTVTGEGPRQIMPVVAAIKERLAEFDGVYDISDDADNGRRELRIELVEGAEELGFSTEQLAEQVRGAVYGLEAHTFPGTREDVDVRVMLDTSARRSLAAIEAMHVISPAGHAVPLREVAHVSEQQGYATVRRLNRERAITVSAFVDRARANPEEVMRALRPELASLEAAAATGTRILERGRQKDVRDSLSTLPLGMAVAVGLVYLVLAWLFQSYLQPLVVITAIPFSVVGMVWGHLALGYELTILSLIGFIALSGVVVNDSLIFIEFYNQQRAEGMRIWDAAMETGRRRFRPIVLTTVTTFFGLMPLVLETSFQAKFLIPMAITISIGLMSATVSTLIVLPAMLLVGDDIRRLARYLWFGRREETNDLDAKEVMPPQATMD